MFAVQHVLRYRNGVGFGAPDPADIFSTRLACYQGYALHKRFESEIAAAFTAEEARELCAVDWAAHNR